MKKIWKIIGIASILCLLFMIASPASSAGTPNIKIPGFNTHKVTPVEGKPGKYFVIYSEADLDHQMVATDA